MATADVTVMTTLLETRLLAGDPLLKDALHNEIDACDIWPSTTFFNAKIEEQTARYEKFGLTGYSLEPNVKSAPGGLRDIQVIGWIAQRHFGTSLDRLPAVEQNSTDLLSQALQRPPAHLTATAPRPHNNTRQHTATHNNTRTHTTTRDHTRPHTTSHVNTR